MTRASLPASYFDGIYAADPDPWRFASSEYERAKYETTLAALPRPRYGSGLEVGCSIGVLTRQLAERCDLLLAVDASERPLAAARERCRDQPRVRFARIAAPAEWPAGTFDLITLSEVVYYLNAPDVARLASRVEASLCPGGNVVLVHWLGATNYPLSGDDASQIFLAEVSGFTAIVHQHRAERFRVDVVERN